jgi:hypothetical protein
MMESKKLFGIECGWECVAEVEHIAWRAMPAFEPQQHYKKRDWNEKNHSEWAITNQYLVEF